MTVFALGNSDPGFAHKSSTIKETIAFSVVGDLASCLNNTTAYLDDRNRRCTCYKGDLLLCQRIRKDFKTMNFKERYRFVRGLRTAATNPIYKEEYRRLCKLHSRIPSTFLHHMPQIFLPWLRWYLLEFENFLRQIDCRITIPYLDWSKDLDNWVRGRGKSDVLESYASRLRR